MSYHEALGKDIFDSSPYTNSEMEMFGRTGAVPGSPLAFRNSLKDPTKKAIYETAKLAALKVVQATSQTAVVKAQAEQAKVTKNAQTSVDQTAAADRILGMPKMTAFIVGGTLAAFAAFMVFKKKKGGSTAAPAVVIPKIP